MAETARVQEELRQAERASQLAGEQTAQLQAQQQAQWAAQQRAPQEAQQEAQRQAGAPRRAGSLAGGARRLVRASTRRRGSAAWAWPASRLPPCTFLFSAGPGPALFVVHPLG